MRGGGFLYKFMDGQDYVSLQWVTTDRTTGQITSTSPILASIQTTDGGGPIHLAPHNNGPWLKVEDGGGDRLSGKWQNAPDRDPNKTEHTDRIISVTDIEGRKHDTLLALTNSPYAGPPLRNATPGRLAALMLRAMRRSGLGE